MKKHATFSPPAVGAGALLTAFGLLVLCILSLLCVSTVRAEERLAEAAAENICAYYEADLQAEEVFARLRSGEVPPQVQRSGDRYAYRSPISETQYLQVTLVCTDGVWQVLQWQVTVEEPSAEEPTLNLWLGG